MPIDSHRTYREKHALFPAQILPNPLPELALVVVIPCLDEPDLLSCLTALKNCDPPGHATEVIVVMSNSEADEDALKSRMEDQFKAAQAWAAAHSTAMLHFYVLHFPDLPKKHAGVGLTRKIGMDEAVQRLHLADQITGPIVSLDADARVEANYLQAVTTFFQQNRKIEACAIAFAFDLKDPNTHEAAMRIELAHRCLVAGLKWAGHPYAFHTFGGAMAVRGDAYEAQAGMNRRKTGEDFDFLQKYIELGKLASLATTRVHFSSRPSTRKPSGIGQEITAYLAHPDPEFPVFAMESYAVIQKFIEAVKNWSGKDEYQLQAELANLPQVLQDFLVEIRGEAAILEVIRYTKDAAAFEKRFFRWFNSLRCFQFLRFASKHGLLKENLDTHVGKLLAKLNVGTENPKDLLVALEWMRAKG